MKNVKLILFFFINSNFTINIDLGIKNNIFLINKHQNLIETIIKNQKIKLEQ